MIALLSAPIVINGVTLSAHPDFVPKEGCGCGADRAAFDYVPDTFWFGMVKFKPPCCIHDDRYEKGGTEEDKIAADREFLNNCLDSAEAVQAWHYPTAWGRHRAMTYYDMVMRAGAKSFNYHKGDGDGNNVVKDSDSDRVVVQRGSRNRARNKRSRDDKYRIRRPEPERGV